MAFLYERGASPLVLDLNMMIQEVTRTEKLLLLLQRQLMENVPEGLDGGVVGPVFPFILRVLQQDRERDAKHAKIRKYSMERRVARYRSLQSAFIGILWLTSSCTWIC